MTKFLTRVFRFTGSSIKPNRGERGVERLGADVRIPIAVVFLSWGVGSLNCKERGEDGATCVQIKKDTLVSLCALDLSKADPSHKIPCLPTWGVG